MKPHVICHMLSSLDGKIDSDALRDVAGKGEYEATGSELGGEGWICGRITMQKHFAKKEQFASATGAPAGPQPVHVARRADSYAVAVDTFGKLQWADGEIDGDHLVCIVSQSVSQDYLAMLREKNISFIVAGNAAVDLPEALELLGTHFGVRTLLLEGGGHINGALLQAGLVDEVSLLIVPGIDGRHDIPAVFDGMTLSKGRAVPLTLKSVEQRDNDTLWIRYNVVRS